MDIRNRTGPRIAEQCTVSIRVLHVSRAPDIGLGPSERRSNSAIGASQYVRREHIVSKGKIYCDKRKIFRLRSSPPVTLAEKDLCTTNSKGELMSAGNAANEW